MIIIGHTFFVETRYKHIDILRLQSWKVFYCKLFKYYCYVMISILFKVIVPVVVVVQKDSQ